jgi:hypothetical protein
MVLLLQSTVTVVETTIKTTTIVASRLQVVLQL